MRLSRVEDAARSCREGRRTDRGDRREWRREKESMGLEQGVLWRIGLFLH